jgi:hypothetical protein
MILPAHGLLALVITCFVFVTASCAEQLPPGASTTGSEGSESLPSAALDPFKDMDWDAPIPGAIEQPSVDAAAEYLAFVPSILPDAHPARVFVNGPLAAEQPERAIAIEYEDDTFGLILVLEAPAQLSESEWYDSAQHLVDSVGDPGFYGSARLVTLDSGSTALLTVSPDGKHASVEWVEDGVERIVEGPTLADTEPVSIANLMR